MELPKKASHTAKGGGQMFCSWRAMSRFNNGGKERRSGRAATSKAPNVVERDVTGREDNGSGSGRMAKILSFFPTESKLSIFACFAQVIGAVSIVSSVVDCGVDVQLWRKRVPCEMNSKVARVAGHDVTGREDSSSGR